MTQRIIIIFGVGVMFVNYKTQTTLTGVGVCIPLNY